MLLRTRKSKPASNLDAEVIRFGFEADARASGHSERRTLVFLGDYVDRGPDSRGVVDRVISVLPQGFDTHFLKGNHEAILLNFLDDAWNLDNWLLNGGGATMLSYGVDTERLARLGVPPEIWRKAFAEALPEAHLRFFKSLKLRDRTASASIRVRSSPVG